MLKDKRLQQLAENIINNSLAVQKGEKVYVEGFGNCTQDFFNELIKAVVRAGAVPFYFFNDASFICSTIAEADVAQITSYTEFHKYLMEKADCYVAVRGYDDMFALSDVSESARSMYGRIFTEQVHMRTRLPHTRWCVLRYPNTAMAALSRMSLQSFEDFYFAACLTDYRKMSKAMQPLKELMDKTDRVRIIGNDTDLSFSIKGIKSIICDGKVNIPDGEVYTAPVKDSINGYVQFNTDTMHDGVFYTNIRLEFVNGRIVAGSSSANNDKFQKVLDTDAGSRYIGEFALGINPYITHPILDILFDEKICGSFHMAIGNSYEDETNNGNVSAIHWDLVKIQTPEHGGGEIWFDDVLVRKDGQFVLPELKGLNPENLK